MQTSLQGIAQKAKTQKRYRFRNLYGALNEAYLHDCWKDIRKQAAYGVDRVSAEEYERNLSRNIKGLVERLKQKRYHAKLVRRKYIPKENGKERPLGIPAVEDKLLQIAVAEILKAIYEQDFLDCSYGYRPQVGVHEASEAMMRRIQFGAFGWIVEADIKGYFDNIDHDWWTTFYGGMTESRLACSKQNERAAMRARVSSRQSFMRIAWKQNSDSVP